MLVLFIGALYLDKVYSSVIKDQNKQNMVFTMITVVIVNVLIELIVVLKEIIMKVIKNCQKKRKNKIIPKSEKIQKVEIPQLKFMLGETKNSGVKRKVVITNKLEMKEDEGEQEEEKKHEITNSLDKESIG